MDRGLYNVQEAVIKTISKKKKFNKAKRLSEEVLQRAEKRRETKGSQRVARRDLKKTCQSEQANKQKKKIDWETLEVFSRKSEIPREHFLQR